MMEAVARDPVLVRHACERLLARAVQTVRLAAAAGARGIWIEDCMTDMISPAAFDALNVPVLRRLVEEIQAAGMHAIYYYCGDPSKRWDALFSVGADALALEESKKGFAIEIEDVVARAGGGTAVLGNLDAVGVLEGASDAELREEIARQVAIGRRNGGRFVMSLGSPVTPDTPAERVRLYCRLAREPGLP
jgi:uroporphyrinogen-III decarboxylase